MATDSQICVGKVIIVDACRVTRPDDWLETLLMSLQVRCPSCKSSVAITRSDESTIKCDSCGIQFLLPDQTDDYGTLVLPTSDAVSAAIIETRFSLVSQIGQGSFGSVWKAWDSQLQRNVALKIPRVDNLPAHELAEFLLDAKAVAQLDHTHIVRVFDIATIEKQTAIVSELVEGGDLKNWLSKNKSSVTFQLTAELVAKIADALHHAHTRGVIHRDLKPGNVMMTADLQPKVIDFGLARREKYDSANSGEGRALGTPAYMPPEQAGGGSGTADGRADIYSLGIMLFEMLTGELPFRGTSIRDLLAQQMQAEPPKPSQLNRTVPLSLETICLKCLRKEPGRRFQTAQELAEELRRWLAGKPILSRPVSWIERFWLLCRRNPLHSAGYAAAVAACIVILVVAFVRITAARDRERASKEKALSRLTDAREAVDLWLATIGEQLRFIPGLAREREQLLQLAEQDYSKFTAQVTDDPNLELERARVLLRLGQVRRGLGNSAGARKSFEQARTIFEQLSDPRILVLSAAEKDVPRIAELAWCDASIWLGLLAEDAGAAADADKEFQSAVTRLEQLRTKYRDSTALDEALALALFNRGALWLRKGQLSTAQPLIEQANQLFTSLRSANRASRRLDSLAASGLELLGAAAKEAGEYQLADRNTKAAIDILRKLVKAEGWNLDWLVQHSRATLQHAALMQQLGREREELADIEAAIQDYESITQAHPELTAQQQELVLALIDAARLRLSQGQLAKAEALLIKADTPLQLLRQQETQNAIVDQLVAHAFDVRGEALLGMGKADQGLEHLSRACELFDQFVASNPDFLDLRLSLALAQLHHAQGLEQRTDAAQTELAYERAVKTSQSLIDRDRPTAEYQFAAAYIAATHADYLLATNSSTEHSAERRRLAESESARAGQLWLNLIDRGQPAPDHILEYAKFLLTHQGERQRDAARALKLLESLLPQVPESANLFQVRGLALIRLKRFGESEKSVRQAIRLRGMEDARDWYCLSLAQHGLQQVAAAQQSFEKGRAWQDHFAPQLPNLVKLRTEVTKTLK